MNLKVITTEENKTTGQTSTLTLSFKGITSSNGLDNITERMKKQVITAMPSLLKK
jgi:hypothetical protein